MIFKIILDQNVCNAKLFHSNINNFNKQNNFINYLEINLINNFKKVFIYIT